MLENELASEFAQQMEQQLKSTRRSKDSTFYSVDNLNEAIGEQVRVRSEFVSSLVEKPSILAEAMILHIKQNHLAQNVEELKQRLSAYFDPDTMQPLPLHEWFNLRPLDLFEKAFEKLPILKRIWIRLTGKYESYRGRYLGQTAIRNATGSGSRPQRAESERSGDGKKDKGAAKPPPSRRTSRAPRPSAAAQAAKRAYSRKQVDSAWDEFGNTIKKDP